MLDATLFGLFSNLVRLPAYWAWVLPIIYVHIGYINQHQTLFSLGSVYLLGLVATVKHPLSKKWFIQGQGVWFLDKIFLSFGIHDVLLKAGIGYEF